MAGGLYAHLLQFINPRSFSILKSTDMLVMVYLGGVGSLTGSLLGAAIFTILMELLRFLGIWRWVIGPLLLVLLMIFRPQGLMGFKEARWLRPAKWCGEQAEAVAGCSPGPRRFIGGAGLRARRRVRPAHHYFLRLCAFAPLREINAFLMGKESTIFSFLNFLPVQVTR